jgi:hypothetical protein
MTFATPSKHRPRSGTRSSTELLACAALAALAAACSDDDAACGPGNAAADGITVTIGAETVHYGMFTSSVNNDCTLAGSGVISTTIQGRQSGATSALSLCLPRPDLLGGDAAPLSANHVPPEAADRVQLFDVSVTLAGGCTAHLEVGAVPSGTASFGGYCAGGTDPAGYAITLAGSAPVSVTCPAGTTTMTATLAGTAAVVAQ